MQSLDLIFQPWANNAEALAADLGLPGITVRKWRNRGNVPPKHWEKIISAAAERGHKLKVEQFLPQGS